MRITHLKTNHLYEPLGFDTSTVALSYIVEEADGLRQAAARIQLATATEESAVCFDTGLVANEYSETGAVIGGIDNAAYQLEYPLAPRTRYFWRVFVRTDAEESAWSGWTWFETAKALDEGWLAKPITTPLGSNVHPVFTRRFTLDDPCETARLYILGLGLYEVYLNGKKIGDEVLQPGFHSYDLWLQYQTYELQPQQGENTLEVWLGDGWFKGRFSSRTAPSPYKGEYTLLAELRLRCEDGTEQIIGTDESWQVTPSPVQMDSIYDGETLDLTADCTATAQAIPAPLDMAKVRPRLSPPLRIQETRRMRIVSTDPLILDAVQNLSGWVKFYCDAPRGTEIRLLYAEHMMNGDVFRGNLRTAQQTFTYVSDGQPREVSPRFTYFGFRYIRVEGWQGAVNEDDFTACVIHSDMERTGFIETSDGAVNRLFENALWSQKGNFLDVPTDCPQRDERKGWTGDAQIFCDTACFNMDAAAFYRKYMQDMALEQVNLGGSLPCVVPAAYYGVNGTAVWGDAATIIPWQVYVHSGDASILRQQYPFMKMWVENIRRETEADSSGCLWSGGAQYGDWLALDADNVHGGTDRALIATAYYYYSVTIVARAAAVLGNSGDQALYGKLAQDIRSAFLAEYFTPSGRLADQTQTALVLVNFLGLYPDGTQEKQASALHRRIAEDGFRLQTGFVGTPWLLSALTEAGNADLAWKLLLRREYPSWLYEVDQGATTIWERWNSINPDGTMNKDGMNSLNHYSYGSVAAWMYRYMAGIQPLEAAPGFRCIRIAPRPSRRLMHCRAGVLTPHGECRVEWRWLDGSRLLLDVTVPFGSSATLLSPDGGSALQLTPGEYTWTLEMPAAHPFSIMSDWRELLADPRARAVIETHFPKAIRGIAFQKELQTLDQVVRSPFATLSRETIGEIRQALGKIQDRGESN